MGRAGILTADERVELLEGEVVVMSPIGNRHAACVDSGDLKVKVAEAIPARPAG